MAKKYLDNIGLAHLWEKIKSYVTTENTKIPSGQVDSTSTATVFTATIPSITEYKDGVCVFLQNGVVTSASGFTLNINGLGAKPVYTNLASATRDTTIFNVNYTMLFVYDENRVSGGCWVCYRGYDANTNTIGYQVRHNSSTLPASDKGYRYRLWYTSVDGQNLVPANTSTATDATTARTPNPRAIDPFGPIYYYSTNGTTNAGVSPTATGLWQQYVLSLGYSYNTTGKALTLTHPDPVYLKCTPQTSGGVVVDGYTQALPTEEDGKVYLFLGVAYNATNIELALEHPVYYYKDGAIRAWANAEDGFSGDYNDLSNKPSIPTKTSDLTNDSGFSTFSGSYTDLTDKGFLVQGWIDENAEERSQNWLLTEYEGSTHIIPQEGYLYQVQDGETDFGNLYLWNERQRHYWVLQTNWQGDWSETDASSPHYILDKPNIPQLFSSSTDFCTPQEVWSALMSGNPVEIYHLDQNYGIVRLYSFNYANAISSLIGQTTLDFNGAVYSYTLVGNTSTNVWNGSATMLAKATDIPTVPTNVSAFTNDAGYITGYTETDPTVPAWAKASTKPSYTASEVGALANTGGEVTGDITLKSDANTNSKSLIFQRGTFTDNYNDWQIQDRGGFLYFDQRGTNSSSFSNQVCFNTSGNVQATTFNGYSLAGASAKAVDTSISAGSTSTNLPTSQAVASFVEGKGYITSAPVSSVNGNTGAVTVRELPAVTSSDNGKVLRVVSGAWSAVSLPSASGVSF